MELCSNNHEEVAFVSSWQNDCPACRYAQEVRDEMQTEIDKLQTEIEEMDEQMEEERQRYLDE